MNRNPDLARPAMNRLPERILPVFHQHMPNCRGIYTKRSFRLQVIYPPKCHPVPESFTLPKCRPAIPPLYTAEILLHGMIQFKISRIPDPITCVPAHRMLPHYTTPPFPGRLLTTGSLPFPSPVISPSSPQV